MSPVVADRVAAQLRAQFGATSTTRITDGSCTNAVYLLDGTPWVARISPGGVDHARVAAVCSVLADAAAAGARVVNPVSPVPVVAADGSWIATVWDRVEVLDAPLDWFDVGVALRSFHDHTPTVAQQQAIGRLDDMGRVVSLVTVAVDRGHLAAVDAGLLARWAELLDGALARVGGDRVLCHGDFWAKNVMSTAAGAVLCDPDNVAVGPFVWDVASVVKQAAQRSITPEDLDRFLAGYGTTIPPQQQWMACILGHDLWWTAWCAANRDQTADLDRWVDGMMARWHNVPLEVSDKSALCGLVQRSRI